MSFKFLRNTIGRKIKSDCLREAEPKERYQIQIIYEAQNLKTVMYLIN